jgi:UDP-glucose 4-epimerase
MCSINMSKILITGGAGFIGSSLLKELVPLDHNHQVIVFDNLSSGRQENLSNWLEKSNFSFIQADMLDPSALEKAVSPCDTVFHLAANPHVQIGGTDTKIDYEQNLVGTYNLLEAMRKSQSCKKMIFTSTSAVYGEADKIPISENYSPLKPISLYGATKLACEAMISGYCHMFDISCIIVRLANIIGPASTHGVIYDLITKLSSNPHYLDIFGNGMQNKSYLYINDCIDTLMRLLERVEKKTFDIFNVGSDDTITVSDISEIIIQQFPVTNVQTRFIDKYDGRGWIGDVREYLLDSSKMKAIGWKPRYKSKDAVMLTVKEYLKRKTKLL